MAKRQHQESDSFPKKGCSGEKLPNLVFVHVNTNVNTWFSALLTRIPCLGKFIMNQGDTFKVIAVYHSLVMADGKSRIGTHAIIDVELCPEPELPSAKKRTGRKHINA